MGYPHRKKGWKIYGLETNEIFVSRDVVFHEQNFPFFPNNMCSGGNQGDNWSNLQRVLTDEESPFASHPLRLPKEPQRVASSPELKPHSAQPRTTTPREDSGRAGPCDGDSYSGSIRPTMPEAIGDQTGLGTNGVTKPMSKARGSAPGPPTRDVIGPTRKFQQE